MVKTTRKPRRKAKTAAVTAPAGGKTCSEIADDISAEALLAIHAEIVGLRAETIAPKKHDRVSTIAWLADRARSIASEQRKAAAEERRRLGGMRYEDVLAFVRQLPAERRAQFVREVQVIDEERSLLS